MAAIKQQAATVERIRDLIAKRESDIERWQTRDSVDRAWAVRMRTAATMLMPEMRAGGSLIDLGCGAMGFKNHIKPEIRYIPADIVKRSDDTILIDLNRGQWPDTQATAAVALGVLEYIYDLDAFFVGLRQIAPMAVITYHIRTGQSEAHGVARLKMGWLSDFDLVQIVSAIEAAGWRLVKLHSEPAKQNFAQYYFKVVDTGVPTPRPGPISAPAR